MEAMAYQGVAAPSSQFLSWLANRRMTLAYTKEDVLGRPGLVVISPRKLPVERMLQEGEIAQIKNGEAAKEIWNYPPGFYTED